MSRVRTAVDASPSLAITSAPVRVASPASTVTAVSRANHEEFDNNRDSRFVRLILFSRIDIFAPLTKSNCCSTDDT